MAITKILYRNGGLAQAIQYITNPDKTDQCVLVDHFNCDPGFAYQQMMNTKRRFHKTDGRQCYHIIQSFKPDEITPELAHEIAKRFAAEHLQGYEAVIGTHVETVCLLSKLQSKEHIEIEVKMDELDLTAAEKKATYEEIREYVFEHTGLKVSHLYIAQVKQKYGIIERENYNKPKSEDAKQPQCPPEKEKAITEAFNYFGML